MEKKTYNRMPLSLAVTALGLDYPIVAGSVNVKCPFCRTTEGTKKSSRKVLHINYGENVFRCPRCNASGGVYKFWAMHRNLPSEKEAAAEIEEYLDGKAVKRTLPISKERQREILSSIPPANPEKLASLTARDKTYSELLGMLTLRKEHKASLLQRGLSEQTIQAQAYRSFPQVCLTDYAKELLYKGCIVEGIPGFYKNVDGSWSLRKMPQGFLIPQRNNYGKIMGFQIRLDNPVDGKYVTLSTRGMECGTGARAYMHITQPMKNDGVLIITEGPLKGQVITELTGQTVLAVPGVNSQKLLPAILQKYKEICGLHTIVTAFDMDLYENPNVMAAYTSMTEAIEDLELKHLRLEWDRSYKGLDDYLYRDK